MCSLKRRAVNFSSKEETFLVSLVKEYKDIIECKLTDTRTHQDKADCWQKIEREFNSTCGEVYRPKEVLRKKYDNIKKRAKKKYAEERCYIRCTGGGPSKDTKFTEIDSEIKEMLGRRIEGMSSEFDGDADDDLLLHTSVNTNATESQLEIITLPLDDHTYSIIEIPNDNNIKSNNCLNAEIEIDNPEPNRSSCNAETDTSNVTNIETTELWSKYTPKMLRSKISATLQLKNRAEKTKEAASGVGDRVSQWAEAKTLLEQSKNKFLSEESNLKLQCIKEKHEEELKLMKEKAQLEMQQMMEEHKLKMEILLLEKSERQKRIM